MENRDSSSRGQGRALRLTFSYEGDKITLADRQVVDRPTQPSAPLMQQRPRETGAEATGQEQDKRPAGQSGFWVELHSRQGRPVYRLVMSNPIAHHAEVPDDKGGFTNVNIENPRGQFFVLVPNMAEAESVVIYSSPRLPAAQGGGPSLAPAEPIARFPLRTRREG